MNETYPSEEISNISASGVPIETASQAQERKNRNELDALKNKYGGLTGTAANIVSALQHDRLVAQRKEEDTAEQEEMLKFLRLEVGLDLETKHKTGSITLDELDERIEKKKRLYQRNDPRMEAAENVQTLLGQTKSAIEKGKGISEKLGS